MTAIVEPGGILLSADVFQSAWFECLAAFVAFNTLIYVGLTLAKLIPWPTMMRPVEIRAWLERTLRRPAPTVTTSGSLPAARKGGAGTASSRLPDPQPTPAPPIDTAASRPSAGRPNA
jgi:hypothetical protein